MNGIIAIDRDMNRDGSRCESYRIGKNKERHLITQFTFKPDNPGGDQLVHSRVQHEVHDMKICQKDLIEEPRKVANKAEPHLDKTP